MLHRIVVTAVLAAALPAAAQAATIHATLPWRAGYAEIDYTAAPLENNDVSIGTFNDYLQLSDPGAVVVSTDQPIGLYCLGVADTGLCTGDSNYSINASLGDGNDVYHASDLLVENIVDGGPGNDTFVGKGWFTGGPGADDFGGGRVDYERATAGVAVTMDNVADDGTPGEHDNVRSAVSDVDGSAFADSIQGNDQANYLFGNDGDDHLSGGGGDDNIFGGYGNNVIDGGAGADVVWGDRGDDTFLMRDGEADRVSCGAGTDTVIADSQDVIDSTCENVEIG